MTGLPEVTNAWLLLAHDKIGAGIRGLWPRRRHPDFLRTVQFVLPGVARARRPQASAVNAAPGHRMQTRVRTAGLQDALSGCSVLGAYRANARSAAERGLLT